MGLTRSRSTSAAVSALRQGREALVELDGHLDGALVWVRNPRAGDRGLPDRLARAARRANEAIASVPAVYPSHPIY